MNFSGVVAALFIWIIAPIYAYADVPVLSAPIAFEKLSSGDLIVLDIRSLQEWKQSGIAKGAFPVSMHAADFPQRLQSILSNYDPKQVALICATGGRSAHITKILDKSGIEGVIDVSEGMFGNGSAPGWIARGLPIVTSDEAIAYYLAVRQSWN